MMNKQKDKVIIIGIDGANFTVIDKLLEQGRMPNLQKLINRGTRAKLKSTIPYLSPVAWSSMISGVNPGKHGIFDFARLSPGTYDITPLMGGDRQVPSVWSYLSSLGKTVGSSNVPFSYPPEDVDGIVISGMDTPPGVKDFISPDDVRKELIEQTENFYQDIPLVRYGKRLMVNFNFLVIDKAIKARTRILFSLMDRLDWDFLMSVFIVTDRVQHMFWDQMDEGAGGKILIDETYSMIDISLGRTLEKIDEQTTVFIVSDHGFERTRKCVSMRKWLSMNGYFHEIGQEQQRFGATASFLGNMKLRIKKNIFNTLLLLFSSTSFTHKILKVLLSRRNKRSFSGRVHCDWGSTKAFCYGTYGGIFINVKGKYPQGIVEPGTEYNDIREEIKHRLIEMNDPENGKALVKNVFFKEEIFFGATVDDAPDIIVDWHSGYRGHGSVHDGSSKSFISNPLWWTGDHTLDGVFIGAGPHVKEGFSIDSLNITDITPTLLHLMGQPVPEHMDGEVATEIIKQSFLDSHKIVIKDYLSQCGTNKDRKYSDAEKKAIEERLRNLGYM